ncbi:ACP S-malonyltransferase [Deinobacterium chartae]|nr:ACP S-malonyltransferase [Deinobacterium chartae]
MGSEMAAALPEAAAVFAAAERAVPGLTRLMKEGPLEDLTLTAHQQPALVTASIAAYRAWREATGLTPAFAAGHSLGEFSAHVAAGTLDLEDALRLVHARGRYMQDAVPAGQGAMSAVVGAGSVESIREVCQATEGVVEIANLNAPGQTVISGEAAAVAAAGAELKARGFRIIPLKVSAPFHCSLMQPARERLAADLEAVAFRPMDFPVIANVTAEPVSDAAQVPALLAEQVTGSVRWTECVQKLAELGASEFIEFGSGNVLTGLLKRMLPEARFYNVHTPADLEAYLAAR